MTSSGTDTLGGKHLLESATDHAGDPKRAKMAEASERVTPGTYSEYVETSNIDTILDDADCY